MTNLFQLCILLLSITSSKSKSENPKCISADSYHTYVCTDNPEATRRAVPSSFTEGPDDTVVASAFDVDLGVEQRITGSDTEQLRIRNVLRKMYAYFEDEVLSRSEYEHIRGRWCVYCLLYDLYIIMVLISDKYLLPCAIMLAKMSMNSVHFGHQ